MKHLQLFILLLSALCFVACSRNVDKNKNQVSLSLWGITFQGENQDEVIRNLIEQTDEFDYYDDDRTEIWRLMFCGVPFGLNLDSVQTNGVTTITDMTLISSHQSKADFEAIKNGLSKRLGNPDIEDYEGGTDEIEGRFYGRCAWYGDECNATLRNLHSEEGGLVVFFDIDQGKQ